MKQLVLIFSLIIFSQIIGNTQCLNNPSIQAGDIDPAPLVNGAGGVLFFTYVENGGDYTDEENDPVTLTICLLNIEPENDISSVGGTFMDHFDWQYDPVSNCYLGTQNQDILGGSGGSITVEFVQTNPIACPDNQMGFNANIQPAACMNGTNQVSDDSESSFTCNESIPTISISDIIVDESAGSAMVQVCLSEISDLDVTMDYTATDDSAITPGDYTGSLSGDLTIPAGDQCVVLTFTIVDDANPEPTENQQKILM